MDVVQESESVEVVGLVTVKLPGTVGAVATLMLVVAVLAPFTLVAVMVYIVVDVGFITVDPMRVLVLKLPGVMATDDAFVMFQLKVEVPAEATTVGDAEKEEIDGKNPDCVVLDAMLDEAETFPTLSCAVV